ncbi:cytochrome bd-I ubiquinol oxidase subunit 1 apoprotein [Salana multivorans]|uniref:Cytochrome bd-I ubiquinol oxidase subunit 1 apoprotein n=1 Tax=Salana multivorans TaxID=120377 RepID=A0A3N2D030_9MICO|nr:cytochrome ubiquinol oxidase subunit I [Salana multivorans]ROR93142.1 cytochrome bd-I ubiquinol oxidase subunit 1 apoprotein [Salana multivorans]
MEALDLARWQFGITTVYHFIFVPLTIGLSTLVAIMQTIWYRTKKDEWLRITKFFGKLLLINFAIGVVTGIVQEFQFGMNWSEYSRFVGDVFGAPLAMEALAAFFVESTFLGLWIFGWEKLSKRVHLACIWAVAFSTTLSAYFILAANSFMQHPVGAVWNEELGRAQLVDIGAVLTNPTTLVTFPHVVAAAWLVGATFVTAIAAIWIVRSVRAGDEKTARTVYRPAALLGIVAILVSGVGLLLTGDAQAKIMYEQQPGKMSAAEAHFETSECVPFSLLAIGDLNDPNNPDGVRHLLSIPCGTSFLATGHFTGPESTVPGTREVQAMFTERFAAEYGEDIVYIPNLMVTYWTFRLMIGPAVFSAALALWGLWLLRKGRVTDNRWFARLAVVAIPMPFLANAFGWIFTEMGRQPWVVVPNIGADGVLEIKMLTADGVSLPSVVAPGTVLTSMIAFTLVYGVLAVIWFRLMRKDVLKGAPEPDHPHDRPSETDADGVKQLDFAY